MLKSVFCYKTCFLVEVEKLIKVLIIIPNFVCKVLLGLIKHICLAEKFWRSKFKSGAWKTGF